MSPGRAPAGPARADGTLYALDDPAFRHLCLDNGAPPITDADRAYVRSRGSA